MKKGGRAEEWVLLITAPDQLTAESWKELLSREGIPVLLRDVRSFLGPSTTPCRLLVPSPLLEKAKAVLEEYFSPRAPGELF